MISVIFTGLFHCLKNSKSMVVLLILLHTLRLELGSKLYLNGWNLETNHTLIVGCRAEKSQAGKQKQSTT
jgi:hypothetical protein